MKFSQYYQEILTDLIQEAEGDEPISPEGEGGVEGVDVLDPNQESALGDEESLEEEPKVDDRLIDLTNLLLNALRFKPSDEFSAYLKMPKFHNLSAFEKLTTIRNVLSDHPERIYQEAEGDEVGVDGKEVIPKEFGDGSMTGLTENEEMDLLRLIIRSINVNPFAMSITLKELPTEADENNFEKIITTIENVLF